MRLRQQVISSISDVKVATLEQNGQIGYELARHAKPVTVGDLKKVLSHFVVKQDGASQSGPVFQEIQQEQHDKPIPNHLQ